jgi:predicted dithiol-disulfide oxidoreductase (DUF899 family)
MLRAVSLSETMVLLHRCWHHARCTQVLPNVTRQHAAAANGVLNTCSRDVLLELLRFLKRAYWPFSWDSSSGAHHATVMLSAGCL